MSLARRSTTASKNLLPELAAQPAQRIDAPAVETTKLRHGIASAIPDEVESMAPLEQVCDYRGLFGARMNELHSCVEPTHLPFAKRR